MNPLLGTAEYDSSVLGQEGKIGSRKATKKKRNPGSKSFNPFLVAPEYEGVADASIITERQPKKRKLDKNGKNGRPYEDSETERPKKQPKTENPGRRKHSVVSQGAKHPDEAGKKERFEPAGDVPDSRSSSNPSDRKFQSRCLTTFSRNKFLTKEPNNKNQAKPNNKLRRTFEKAKNRNGASLQNGFRSSVGDKQKKKWTENNDDSLSVPKKKKNKQKDKGPKTWGLPSSLVGNSESLSLEEIGGFSWNATPQDFAKIASSNNGVAEEESEESEDESVVKVKKKLTPAEKRAKALEEEKNMKRKERELIESENNPQSPDHFERLLLGNPNSAELWIKYIGYHAVNADINKARAVAMRAVKRIDPQLTAARLDVWKAFLNLDFTFSPPEVFKETFSEALRSNDDYAVNSRVLSLYAEAKNVSEVDQLANTMVRKYKDKLENWLQCQNALMIVGQPDKARHMLQKALSVMNKKDHITLISRFALLENKHGFSEQAEALFENLMTSFPQRVDLLSVYVDMLVKSDRIDFARSVLERASNNHLPVRKMKAIYTKWIAFEEAHGTTSAVSKVEEAAQQYVSRLLKPHTESADDDSSLRNVGGNNKIGTKSAKMVHDDADSSEEEEEGEDDLSDASD